MRAQNLIYGTFYAVCKTLFPFSRNEQEVRDIENNP